MTNLLKINCLHRETLRRTSFSLIHNYHSWTSYRQGPASDCVCLVCVCFYELIKPSEEWSSSYTPGNAAQPGRQRAAQPVRPAATETSFTSTNYTPEFDYCLSHSFLDTCTLCDSYLVWRAPPSPDRWPVWWPPPGNNWASSWAAAAPACHWSCSRCRWGTGGLWSKHRCSSSTRCSAAAHNIILLLYPLFDQKTREKNTYLGF